MIFAGLDVEKTLIYIIEFLSILFIPKHSDPLKFWVTDSSYEIMLKFLKVFNPVWN